MNWNDPQLVLAVVKAILINGVGAVLVIADILRSEEETTPERIEKLFITKKPEEYFK